MDYVLIRESFPIARKPYRCIWCGAPICEKVLLEDVELIIRAVNTFDQAREALRLAVEWVDECTPKEVVDKITQALAAMEGQP